MKSYKIKKIPRFKLALSLGFFVFMLYSPILASAANYKYEGVAFKSCNSSGGQLTEVFRFFSPITGDHFQTSSLREKKKIINNLNYQYEGATFYAHSSQKSGTSPVFRFYNPKTGDHFLTISESEKEKLQGDDFSYSYEGIAFYAYETKESGTKPVYRFYNPNSGDHFLTISENEKEKLQGNDYQYEYEGIAFYTYASSQVNRYPVYRFRNTKNGDHLLSIKESEERNIINKIDSYEYEGLAFYAYKDSSNGAEPVYRFYNSRSGDHFLTSSNSEKSKLQAGTAYRYEGIAFYSCSSSESGSQNTFRFYDQASGDHLFTASESEKDRLQSAYASNSLGPEIKVGLWYYTRDSINESAFRIIANKDYRIKDHSGNTIATINADDKTRVGYDSDGKLRIYDSISEKISNQVVYFEAADGNNSDMIFDVYRPDSPYDQYRGKIEVRYNDTDKHIWVINVLPLEHYVWGDGELQGTGDMDHNRVMVTSFRTYGYWKILYSTAYAIQGFDVDTTSGNQIYKGYDYEKDHRRIKQAAQDTRGKIVKHDGDVAITPYSSWTDGRTRSYEERWGSTAYPWCQSVSDPYGKHPSLSTSELVSAGNHMVGLSAHGSLELAGEEGWDWKRILNYYFTDIDITEEY